MNRDAKRKRPATRANQKELSDHELIVVLQLVKKEMQQNPIGLLLAPVEKKLTQTLRGKGLVK